MALDPIEARHKAVQEKLTQTAQADDRVVAAWLQGSRADGTADACSDIDCYLAVRNDAYDSFDRLEFLQRATNVLAQAQLPAN